MNTNSITTNFINDQHYVQDVQLLRRISFHELLKSIAHEYGTYKHDEFTVNLHELNTSDKRLILSHILDSEDYENSCQSFTRTDAYYKENIHYIEKQMCDAEYEAYLEIMEEAGLISCSHKDNNEIYFTR